MHYDDFELLASSPRVATTDDGKRLLFSLQAPHVTSETLAAEMDMQAMTVLKDAATADTASWPQALALGAALSELLLPPPLWHALNLQITLAADKGDGVRVRLMLSGAELNNWPWEFMVFNRGGGEAKVSDFLALMPNVSLVRHTATPLPSWSVRAQPPVRVCVVTASPVGGGWVKLEVEQERSLIATALKGCPSFKLQAVDHAQRHQLPGLDRPAHVFHFAGHGIFEVAPAGAPNAGQGKGSLILEDAHGDEDVLDAEILALQLRQAGVRVAVLGACQTAQRDELNAWSSVAEALLKAELGAVVGMQFPVLDTSALCFAKRFYGTLALGLGIDEAVAGGRVAVAADGDALGWATPALYLRARDGVIFEEFALDPALQAARVDALQQIGDLRGRAVNVKIGVMTQGQVSARQKIKTVRSAAKAVNVPIEKLGGGVVFSKQVMGDVAGDVENVSVDSLGLDRGVIDADTRIARMVDGAGAVGVRAGGGLVTTARDEETVHRQGVPPPRATSPVKTNPRTGVAAKSLLPALVRRNIDRFVGRDWLLPVLLQWWDDGSERCFVLTGEPGCGKSMLVAWLAGFGPEPAQAAPRAQLSQLRQAVKAVHFCQAGNDDPKDFADAMLGQLLARPELRALQGAVAATLSHQVALSMRVRMDIGVMGDHNRVAGIQIDGALLGDQASFNRIFKEPLTRLYEQGHRAPMLILVDALDEALSYQGDHNLPELLSTLGDYFPPQVRFLVTTSDDPRVLSRWHGTPTFDLLHEAGAEAGHVRPAALDDVRQYVLLRQPPYGAAGAVPDEAFAAQLAQQSEGVFLYAAMVLDEWIPAQPSQGMPAQVGGSGARGAVDGPLLPGATAAAAAGAWQAAAGMLPRGLAALYDRLLTQGLGGGDAAWFAHYQPVLGLAAVAQGAGLTAAQMAAILGQDIGQALRACKRYLDGSWPDGPFRVFHPSFAAFLLSDPNNQDHRVDARAMHARVVDHYWRPAAADASSCDDYGLAHLAAHLEGAGQGDRLAELITLPWLRLRAARQDGRYDGVVADLQRASRHAQARARATIDAGAEPSALAECLRLALLRTSVRSRASVFEPAAVECAVATGLWSLARALSVALQAREGVRIVQLMEAALKATTHGGTRGAAADSVARRDSADLDARRAAARGVLPAVQALDDMPARAAALRLLVHELDGAERDTTLQQALQAALAVAPAELRIGALAALLPLLTGAQHELALQQALDALAAARPAAWSGFGMRQTALLDAFAALAPQLQGPGLAQAAALVQRQFADPEARARALALLAQQVPAEQQEQALLEAVDALRRIEDAWALAAALQQLAPALQGSPLEQALALAHGRLQALPERAPALVALASRCDVKQRDELLSALLAQALASDDTDACEGALEALVPLLGGPLLDTAMQHSAAMALQTRVALATRAQTLLGERAPDLRACVDDVLAAVARCDQPWRQASLLLAVAPLLSGTALQQAVQLARAIQDDGQRVRVLAALAQAAEGAQRADLLQQAVTAACGCNPWAWSDAQTLLAPLLDGALLQRLLERQAIADENFCARALQALAGALQGTARETALRDALRAVAAVKEDWERAQLLTELAPELDGELLADALRLAHALDSHAALPRCQALCALARRLAPGNERDSALRAAQAAAEHTNPGAARAKAWTELALQSDGSEQMAAIDAALVAASGIGGLIAQQGDALRAEVLVTLAPLLTGAALERALSLVSSGMAVGRARGRALVALLPRLPEPQRAALVSQELTRVQVASSDWQRVEGLFGLAPTLQGPVLDEVLTWVQGLEDGRQLIKANALMALLPQLHGAGKAALAADLLARARALAGESERAWALTALVPLLEGPLQADAIDAALAALGRMQGDEGLGHVLEGLAPFLDTARLADAWAVIARIGDWQVRLRALRALAHAAMPAAAAAPGAAAAKAAAVRDGRLQLLDQLQGAAAAGDRRDVYMLCAVSGLWRAPWLGADTVAAAARHVSAIGLDAQWS